MAAPSNKRDALADIGGLLVPAHIRHYFPASVYILDVGAGWGKYHQLLPEYRMDACEIWEPYVKADRLKEQYDTVFVEDICDLQFDWYDVIILGDVFEHITQNKAVELLERIKGKCTQLYVVVPFEYPQEEVDGNPYEAHQQADLNNDIMQRVYGLTLLGRDKNKGVYIK